MAMPTEDGEAYCIAVAKLQPPYVIRGKKLYATYEAAEAAADKRNAALPITEYEVAKIQAGAYTNYLYSSRHFNNQLNTI